MLQHLYDLLSQGKIQEVLDGLLQLEGIPDRSKSKCLILVSRLSTLEMQNINGVISFDNYTLERNRISLAVFEVLESLKKNSPSRKRHSYFNGSPTYKVILRGGITIAAVVCLLLAYFLNKGRQAESANVDIQVLTFQNDSLYKSIDKKALKYLISLFNNKFTDIPITLVDVYMPDSLIFNREKLEYMVTFSERQKAIHKMEQKKGISQLGFVEFQLPGNPLLADFNGFPVFTLSGMEDDSAYNTKQATIPVAYRYFMYITLIHVFFTDIYTKPLFAHDNFTGCAFDFSKDRREKSLFLENPRLCASHEKIVKEFYRLDDQFSLETVLSFNWLSQEEVQNFNKIRGTIELAF